MNIISIKTKFKYNDFVSCDKIPCGQIIGINLNQSKHMRPDAAMIQYLVEPKEFIGMEHDEDKWISEWDLKLI